MKQFIHSFNMSSLNLISHFSSFPRYMRKLSLLLVLVVPCLVAAQDTLPSRQIREIAWSPFNDKLAVAYQDGSIQISDLNTPFSLLTLSSSPAPILAINWSPNGTMLASGSAGPDNTIRIWDASTGDEIFSYGNFGQDVLVTAWKPDGSQLIAVTAEGFTDLGNSVVVDLETYQTTLLSLPAISDIAWSPDQTMIALAGIGSVYIFDAPNFQRIAEYPIDQTLYRSGLQNQPVRVVWSPDGTHIATGMGDGRIFVWKLNDQQADLVFEGHDYRGTERFLGWIYDLRFDVNNQILTTISGDGTIRTWDLDSGLMIAEQRVASNYAASFSPYGGRIALALAPIISNGVTSIQANTTNVIQTLANGAVQIVVPDPSPERLQAIAAACGAPPQVVQVITSAAAATDAQAPDAMSALVDTIEALPADAIPPACAADLRAVAEAIAGQ